MPKLLVTGANGFVGKHLIAALQNSPYEVIAIDSSWGNISQQSTWEKFPKADIVVHLAAKTFVPDSWMQPQLFLEINAMGTLQALEYCKKHQAKMVFISSYLYGNPQYLPIDENATIATPNPYALSKKTAEDFCQFYAHNYGIPLVILRPFNIYGPGQSANFLIPLLIHQIKNNTEVRVKDLHPKRDYVHINDLVRAIILSLEISGAHTLNIASGESYSVSELIAMLQHICGTQLPVISEAVQRQAEIMDTRADISKAVQILNWQPQVSIVQGLQQLVNDSTL